MLQQKNINILNSANSFIRFNHSFSYCFCLFSLFVYFFCVSVVFIVLHALTDVNTIFSRLKFYFPYMEMLISYQDSAIIVPPVQRLCWYVNSFTQERDTYENGQQRFSSCYSADASDTGLLHGGSITEDIKNHIGTFKYTIYFFIPYRYLYAGIPLSRGRPHTPQPFPAWVQNEAVC